MAEKAATARIRVGQRTAGKLSGERLLEVKKMEAATVSPADTIRAVEAGRRPEKTASTFRLLRNLFRKLAMIRIMMMPGVMTPRVAASEPSQTPHRWPC